MKRKVLFQILLIFILLTTNIFAIDDYSDLDIHNTYKEYLRENKPSDFETWDNQNVGWFFEFSTSQEISFKTTITNPIVINKENEKVRGQANLRLGWGGKSFFIYAGYQDSELTAANTEELPITGIHMGIGYSFIDLSIRSNFDEYILYPAIYIQGASVALSTSSGDSYSGINNESGLNLVLELEHSYSFMLGYKLAYTIWNDDSNGISQTTLEEQWAFGIRIKL